MTVNRYRLDQVRLGKESRIYKKMMKNSDYLLKLDPKRLLFHFFDYAGIQVKDNKTYGGWEGPWSAIRGEFLGHYMCACINNVQNFMHRDKVLSTEYRERVTYIVNQLESCQKAIAEKNVESVSNPEGYVAAIPIEQLDMVERLEDRDGYDGGVPYYVHHKTFKGLLEAYKVLGNEKALLIAKAFAHHIYKRFESLSEEHLEKMLNSHRYPVQYFKEFGGMHEVLLHLYQVTKDKKHLTLAQKFDRRSFREALINDIDEMAHHMQHANSEIPCVSGMGAYYELSGDESYKQGVLNFMDWMKEGHTFSTGGTSGPSVYPDYGGEFFNYPNLMYGHVTFTNPERHKDAGESCCAHNLNKISDQIFIWTKEASIADEYEKRFVNCVLPQQNDETGMFLYNLNLHQGAVKKFGNPEDSFWCCYCSGIEAYSSLQSGAFYHNEGEIYLNNFVDCILVDEDKGLVIKEETTFPDNGQIKLSFELQEPTDLDFHIRIPSWAKGKKKVLVNGKPVEEDMIPSSYLSIKRTFSTNDIIDIDFEFNFYTERMPDRPEYIGVKYGPNLLVGCGSPFTRFKGSEEDLIASLKPTGVPCEFQVDLTKGRAVFQPLHRVRNELYNGYTIITKPIKEIQIDSLDLKDQEEATKHKVNSVGLKKVTHDGVQGIGTGMKGEISFSMKVRGDKENYLKCLYWGNEYGRFNNFAPTIRLFDIQVKDQSGEYVNIATQLLDQIQPNEWHDKIYPIPSKLTNGKESIEIRMKAKPFGIVEGVVGNLYDKITIHHY